MLPDLKDDDVLSDLIWQFFCHDYDYPGGLDDPDLRACAVFEIRWGDHDRCLRALLLKSSAAKRILTEENFQRGWWVGIVSNFDHWFYEFEMELWHRIDRVGDDPWNVSYGSMPPRVNLAA